MRLPGLCNLLGVFIFGLVAVLRSALFARSTDSDFLNETVPPPLFLKSKLWAPVLALPSFSPAQVTQISVSSSVRASQ